MPDDRAPAMNPQPPTGGDTPVSRSTESGPSPAGDASSSAARNRRRRGSRGGARNRSGQKPQPAAGAAGPAGAQSSDTPSLTTGDAFGDQPDLPDLPWEGEPAGRAPHQTTLAPSTPPARPAKGESSARRVDSSAQANQAKADAQAKGDPQAKADPQAKGDPQAKPADRGRQPRGNQPRREGAASPKDGAPRDGAPQSAPQSPATEGEAARPKRQKGRRGTPRRHIPTGDYTMCVHVRPHVTQIAVLDGRTLIEHYVSHADDDVAQINGNIYLGRVQNVLPGMEAAFVDIATPKNAVLYRGDVQIDRDVETTDGGDQSTLRIENLLRNGQLVICQVTKNPIGAKGARLTQDVSIAGRFVVLVPNSGTYGISKRLPDDERKRLRGVLDTVKPADHGIIVRTAAAGADADELRRDVVALVQRWEQISAKAAKLKGPALLHREPNLAVRIIREEFSEAYRRVIIDDERVHEEVRSYVETISPDLAGRIELFDTAAEPLPIFEQFHVHEQLHKAIDRKVWLPSGGSIIIERTEALTVIDVNTGKNVGSTSLEETVFRNNLEAATEIARQLRLRDIGGIIVIDFIDMEIKANRAGVVAHFREELSKDKTRTQVYEISELGLVEMTRKRISEGLLEALSDTCPTCSGRGFVFDPNVLTD